jgi:hypothetical protein
MPHTRFVATIGFCIYVIENPEFHPCSRLLFHINYSSKIVLPHEVSILRKCEGERGLTRTRASQTSS